MLFLLDPQVSLAVLAAAAVHEGGHLLALALCGGRLESLRLGLMGAQICYSGRRMGYGQEALCALAGPGADLLLALAASALGQLWGASWLSLLAGTALVQGLFNLLPGRSLDGGRALWMLAAARLGPEGAERLCCWVSCVTAFLLLTAGAALLWRTGRNFTLLMPGLTMLFGEGRRLTKRV